MLAAVANGKRDRPANRGLRQFVGNKCVDQIPELTHSKPERIVMHQKGAECRHGFDHTIRPVLGEGCMQRHNTCIQGAIDTIAELNGQSAISARPEPDFSIHIRLQTRPLAEA